VSWESQVFKLERMMDCAGGSSEMVRNGQILDTFGR
jgi:hypothetical protein